MSPGGRTAGAVMGDGRRPWRRTAAAASVVVAVGGTVALGLARRGRDEGARCGRGFVASGAHCEVAGSPASATSATSQACPAPLASAAGGCVAPDTRVRVPETTLVIGPSDWEAERVAPHTIHVEAFELDAFEVTAFRYAGASGSRGPRAASGMTRDAAAAFCLTNGGRLPTEDEWIAAATAAMNPPPRYPWGDTGAVCRRAAWGLLKGPCATGADGPDTVGSHPDGDSPLGLHDLAGNVAEWVASSSPVSAPGAAAVAKGGSWQSDLASDLRIWARLELPPLAGDARVGFRCAYSVDR